MSIEYLYNGGVVALTINRPAHRNAFDPVAMLNLRRQLIRFEEDSNARVAIATGARDEDFRAWADIFETCPNDLTTIRWVKLRAGSRADPRPHEDTQTPLCRVGKSVGPTTCILRPDGEADH